MRVYACDDRRVELPAGHRFPMGKYELLRQALVAQGVVGAEHIERAPDAPLEAVLAVHQSHYVEAFLAGRLSPEAIRRIGFPWSPALVARVLASVGGTLAATEAALREGCAGTLAGGTHHAHADHGAGFCVFNDAAVAARRVLDQGRRVLVFDADVHQGDGTARMLSHEPGAFTCSLHGQRNYPSRKARSDLDVALDDGTGDDEYLQRLHAAWSESIQRARPDVVLYQGGVDPLREDRLGRLALTHAGLAQRDRYVIASARALGLPIVLMLGGGYAEPVELSVRAHLGTYRAAAQAGFRLGSMPGAAGFQGGDGPPPVP